jgi:pimeloyl-ACP methyl ester carboxylesterase
MIDNPVYQSTKLTVPLLAVGAAGSLADFMAANAREYQSDVNGVVFPDSGHWIYEERPRELTQMLRDSL